MNKKHTSRFFGRDIKFIAFVVLALFVYLALSLILSIPQAKENARRQAARGDIKNIEAILIQFKEDIGRYPEQEEGIQGLLHNPGLENWQGPYIKSGQLTDPWGNPYIYCYSGKHNPERYDLYSLGPDNRERTEDDITNW